MLSVSDFRFLLPSYVLLSFKQEDCTSLPSHTSASEKVISHDGLDTLSAVSYGV